MAGSGKAGKVVRVSGSAGRIGSHKIKAMLDGACRAPTWSAPLGAQAA